MRYGPGTDAWLSPPDPKVPPSGGECIYVERPVPVVDVPGEDGPADWVELEVDVVYDEGNVYSAKVDGEEFCLTRGEIQDAEEAWAMREPDERDEDDRRDDE